MSYDLAAFFAYSVAHDIAANVTNVNSANFAKCIAVHVNALVIKNGAANITVIVVHHIIGAQMIQIIFAQVATHISVSVEMPDLALSSAQFTYSVTFVKEIMITFVSVGRLYKLQGELCHTGILCGDIYGSGNAYRFKCVVSADEVFFAV